MRDASLGIFRHFKGGYYLVHAVAVEEETQERVVVYQSLKDGVMWTRPLKVFQEPVPKGKDNPTGQEYRFERVQDFNNQIQMIPTGELVEELNMRNDNPYELLAPQDIKIWREQYLTGVYESDFIDELTTVEDFNIDTVHDTLEEAVERVKKLGRVDMRILKRVYVKQDFDI